MQAKSLVDFVQAQSGLITRQNLTLLANTNERAKDLLDLEFGKLLKVKHESIKERIKTRFDNIDKDGKANYNFAWLDGPGIFGWDPIQGQDKHFEYRSEYVKRTQYPSASPSSAWFDNSRPPGLSICSMLASARLCSKVS